MLKRAVLLKASLFNLQEPPSLFWITTLMLLIYYCIVIFVDTGYGQDLSGFGHSFADPSQQTASYGAPSAQPTSAPQPTASTFGRGQNHNVQGFHPYRRWPFPSDFLNAIQTVRDSMFWSQMPLDCELDEHYKCNWRVFVCMCGCVCVSYEQGLYSFMRRPHLLCIFL